MKRIFSSELLPQVAHMRNLLEQAGIRCQLRNEGLGGGAGEIPFFETWPQLWVEEADERRATQLIAALAEQASSLEDWHCSCGERIEGQFSECWNCGAARGQ